MTSPLDKFSYGTFTVRRNSETQDTIKRSGHRLGDLAAVRFDDYECSCGETHEVWGVLNVIRGGYPTPMPTFFCLDDAANYILDVVDLHDWSRPITMDLLAELTIFCLKHNGIPLRFVALERVLAQGGQSVH